MRRFATPCHTICINFQALKVDHRTSHQLIHLKLYVAEVSAFTSFAIRPIQRAAPQMAHLYIEDYNARYMMTHITTAAGRVRRLHNDEFIHGKWTAVYSRIFSSTFGDRRPEDSLSPMTAFMSACLRENVASLYALQYVCKSR